MSLCPACMQALTGLHTQVLTFPSGRLSPLALSLAHKPYSSQMKEERERGKEGGVKGEEAGGSLPPFLGKVLQLSRLQICDVCQASNS